MSLEGVLHYNINRRAVPDHNNARFQRTTVLQANPKSAHPTKPPSPAGG